MIESEWKSIDERMNPEYLISKYRKKFPPALWRPTFVYVGKPTQDFATLDVPGPHAVNITLRREVHDGKLLWSGYHDGIIYFTEMDIPNE
mgnify:CR=1 FL=1